MEQSREQIKGGGVVVLHEVAPQIEISDEMVQKLGALNDN